MVFFHSKLHNPNKASVLTVMLSILYLDCVILPVYFDFCIPILLSGVISLLLNPLPPVPSNRRNRVSRLRITIFELSKGQVGGNRLANGDIPHKQSLLGAAFDW